MKKIIGIILALTFAFSITLGTTHVEKTAGTTDDSGTVVIAGSEPGPGGGGGGN